MMRKKILITVLCLLFAALAGCKTTPPPTQSQKNWADRNRDIIRRFMRDVERHIQAGDHKAIMRKFVYRGRGTTMGGLHANYITFKLASWIPELSGYQILDLDKALHDLHWSDLNRGEVLLEVEATCTHGRKSKDRYRLFRPEGEWMIISAKLRTPVLHSTLNLDSSDRENINEVLEPIFAKFRAKAFEEILDALPGLNEAQYRPSRAGMFSWIPGIRGRTVAIREDLERIAELSIIRWPTPDAGYPARYAGGMSVYLSYEVTYLAKDRPGQTKTLAMRIFLRENEEGQWQLRMLRFHGPPFAK